MFKVGPSNLIIESWLFYETSSPNGPKGSIGRRLEVTVIFTSAEPTIAAIDRACALLSGLGGSVSLVDAQIVPYPLGLGEPPVSLDFLKQRLQAITNKSQLDIAAYVYLCRSPLEMLLSLLAPGSIVVIGCWKNWWPSWERKLAKRLVRAGIHTLLIENGARRTKNMVP